LIKSSQQHLLVVKIEIKEEERGKRKKKKYSIRRSSQLMPMSGVVTAYNFVQSLESLNGERIRKEEKEEKKELGNTAALLKC